MWWMSSLKYTLCYFVMNISLVNYEFVHIDIHTSSGMEEVVF